MPCPEFKSPVADANIRVLTTDSSFVLPWHQYCRHYDHPPEYAFGYWKYDPE